MHNDQMLTVRANERASVYLGHGLVAAMLVCAVAPFIFLGERVFPGWEAQHVVAVLFVIALEGFLSWRASGRFVFPSQQWFLYRGAEFVVILLGLKAFMYQHRGWESFWLDLRLWQADFRTFFDGEYVYACVLAIVIWLAATRFAISLRQLEGDEQLLDLEREGGVQSDRAGTRRRLISDIFLVGGIMVFFTAVLRSNLALPGIPSPVVPVGLLNVVLYFVLALALLALTQFAILRARWSLDRIPIAHNIAPRWAIYSAALVVMSAAIAIMLPTRYSFGLLDTLAFILALVQFVLYLLLLLLLLPVQLLTSLFFGRTLGLPPPPGRSPDFQPPSPPEPSAPVPWIEVMRSIVFWAVCLAIIGFSVYFYVRQRADLLPALGRLPAWNWLTSFWNWLWGGMGRFSSSVAHAIRSVTTRRGTSENAPWNYVGLGRLSPRDRVRFYYLALVRRAAEVGLPRRPAQTPLEYQDRLSSSLTEASGELGSLTGAFMDARYSQQVIPRQTADLAHNWWQRLRRALRARRKE